MERLDKAALNALQPPEFRYFWVRLDSRGGSALAWRAAAGNGDDEPGGLGIRPLCGLLQAPEEGGQLGGCCCTMGGPTFHLSEQVPSSCFLAFPLHVVRQACWFARCALLRTGTRPPSSWDLPGPTSHGLVNTWRVNGEESGPGVRPLLWGKQSVGWNRSNR